MVRSEHHQVRTVGALHSEVERIARSVRLRYTVPSLALGDRTERRTDGR